MSSRSVFKHFEQRVPERYRSGVAAQFHRDMVARQRSTILFNPGIFALVCLGILLTRPTIEKLLILSIVGVLLAGSIAYRYIALGLFIDAIEEPSKRNWLHLHVSLACSALAWGIFLALAALPTAINEHFPLVYAGAVGLAAGGVVTLSLKSSFVQVFILGITLPTIAVTITGHSVLNPGLSALLLVFSAAMYWVARNARTEYTKSVLSNLILQEQSEKLTRLTTLDWLTKVSNRSNFDKILVNELQRVKRIGYPLSLLMIDVDHFKCINDNYGHLVGDTCLKATAARIKACLKRETDIVARYGGEEFCVLLPGMGHEASQELAESIRAHVSELVVWHYNNPISLTVSIGGASLERGVDVSRETVLSRADSALYTAKSRGRNRVCWHEETTAPVEGDR